MKKVSLLILVSLVLICAFVSCQPKHEHEWAEATCTSPKTCTVEGCGATEGEALGHDWTAATCETLKTCTRCQATEGELADHDWEAATCAAPKTCKVCNKTEGNKLAHTWVEATCTEAKHCSVCNQKSGKALGHDLAITDCNAPAACQREGCNYTEGEAAGHTWVDATCTAPKTCSVCSLTEGEALGHDLDRSDCSVPAACKREGCDYAEATAPGHNWKNATCTEPKTCTVCGKTDGDALGHDFGEASCTEPATCSVCGYTSGEAIGHDMTEATCTEPAYCTRCDYTDGVTSSHELTHEAVDGKAVYTCVKCEEYFAVAEGYFMDGSQETLTMVPVNNNKNGYVTNSDKPVSVDGHYELLLGKDLEYTLEPQFEDGAPVLNPDGTQSYKINPSDTGQLQMWVPSNATGIKGLTSGNYANGFLSFKFNARMEFPIAGGNVFRMQFVDLQSQGARWSPEWCIDGYLFCVDNLASDDQKEVRIMGYDNFVLKTVTIGDDKFTGWIDVKIGIELDPDKDTINLHYYIDGQYIESLSRPLTTQRNGVDSVYITGSTVNKGTGIMFDDLAFGCTESGYWPFDVHTHTWIDANCENPKTCKVCRETEGEAGGHVWTDATCEAPKTCSICKLTEGEALGHDFGEAACGTAGTCTRCNLTTESIDHVFADATCTAPKTCTRTGCEATEGEALGHDYADATCTAPKTCKVCGETDGEPAGHTWVDATCTESKYCSVCNIKEGEPNGHTGGTATCTERAKCDVCGESYNDLAPHVGGTATCTERAKCDACGNAYGSPLGHLISVATVDAKLVYSCESCDASYTVDTVVYNIDGTDYTNMEGRGNATNFTVGTGSNQPAIVDGHYELINTTGNRGQMQLWIPGENQNQIGFEAEKGAVGFLSFKLNASIQNENVNEAVTIKLVDSISNQGGNRWQPAGILGDVISIFPVQNGVAVLKGMNGAVVAELEVDENNFTGWVDIKVGLELNAEKDQITLHYYINGRHVTTFSKELTTATNAFNSIYLSGYTTTKGSGLMLDDIVLGYTANGEWTLDSCAHDFLDATCDAPAKCKLCGAVDGKKLGHIGGEATCTSLAVCTRCEQPYGELGHDVPEATCGVTPVCTKCGETVGEAPKHAALTWSYADGKATYSCASCNNTFVVDTNYHFDGDDFDNMELNDERNVFDVKDAVQNGNGWDVGDPVVNADGQYEVLNSKGTNPVGTSKATLWIPCTNGGQENFEGFTCAGNTVGFFSFSLNAYTDNIFEMQLVDSDTRGGGSNPAGNFWTDGALEKFFKISAPSNGKVTVTGWTGTLATIEVDENNFTGWFDVTVGIELTEDNKITLDYYIDDKYVGSSTKDMKIVTGKIDGVYIQLVSSKVGSGYLFDDLCFGYVSAPAEAE